MKKTLTSKKKLQNIPPTLERRVQIACSSRTAKRIKVGESITFIVSIKDLAYIVGRSRPTILRYEKMGIFPPAPIKIGERRYYRVDFCKKLFLIVEKFPLHIKPSQELIIQINILFKEEREYLNNNKIKLCR